MRSSIRALLLAVCLSPPWLASAQSLPSADTDNRDPADVSERLDLFVREAIDQGLLSPADTENTETESEAPDPSGAAPLADHLMADCDPSYALGFVGLDTLSQYQDIYAFRAPPDASDVPADPHPGVDLSKAYLALGLNTEALMALKGGADPDAVAYRKLAVLMENRQPPDVDYFRSLAGCHEQAGLWLSVALLSEGQEEGVQLLRDHLSDFRRLPLQLRINVAAIAVPALDKQGERVLAQKLMADFSAEEVQGSSRLQFISALAEMGKGDAEAETIVRSYLTQPRFREQALAAMIRNERPVHVADNDGLLDELIDQISKAENEGDIAGSLGFALKELSAQSRYLPMIDLADLPVLQTEPAQDLIAHHLISGLQRDLDSDDPMRNLAAIGTLVHDPDVLGDRAERADLYASATMLSARFGLAPLADQLSLLADIDEDAAHQRAALAFRRHDDQAVYALARRHPDSGRINLLAALSAIRGQDKAALATFEGRLALEPETILALIEQDAAGGHWVVSENVYRAAETLSESGYAQRVERVMALKRDADKPASVSSALPMSRVPEALHHAGLSLGSMAREAH